MGKNQFSYPPEYRARMVELVRAGRTPVELSREFEPTAQSIRNWVKQADLDEGLRQDGLTSAEGEELRRLRRLKKKQGEAKRALKRHPEGSSPVPAAGIARSRTLLGGAIERVSGQIEQCMRPFEEAAELLDTIPGVDRLAAQSLIAEMGMDMSQFPTHRHLASWGGCAQAEIKAHKITLEPVATR